MTFGEWAAWRRAGGCSHNPDDWAPDRGYAVEHRLIRTWVYIGEVVLAWELLQQKGGTIMKLAAISTIVIAGLLLAGNVSAESRGKLQGESRAVPGVECTRSTDVEVAGFICDTIEKFCETCPTNVCKGKCREMYEEHCEKSSG